jgi:hypothetical protein
VGLSPCASQMRCTEALLTPLAAAMARQLQCVLPSGARNVLSMTSASLA